VVLRARGNGRLSATGATILGYSCSRHWIKKNKLLGQDPNPVTGDSPRAQFRSNRELLGINLSGVPRSSMSTDKASRYEAVVTCSYTAAGGQNSPDVSKRKDSTRC
jgi:hypothetical protein